MRISNLDHLFHNWVILDPALNMTAITTHLSSTKANTGYANIARYYIAYQRKKLLYRGVEVDR